MSKLVIRLPINKHAANDDTSALPWILQRIENDAANRLASLQLYAEDNIELAVHDSNAHRVTSTTDASANTVSGVEIVSSMHLQPPSHDRLVSFLKQNAPRLDHIGLNLSHRDITENGWHEMIAAIAAQAPLYRLEIGSPNDILLAVQPDPATGAASVLELVRDQSAAQTSVHLCLAIAAPRKEIEAAFPQPFGGYKPGDEPFFRSVALPPALAIPAYLDFSFEDGSMTPWPQIVAAMGKRIES